jgi:hypothetical protein
VKAPKEIKSQLRQMGLVLDTRYLLISSPKCLGFLFGFLPSIFGFLHTTARAFSLSDQRNCRLQLRYSLERGRK